jgi:hypothetical protein
MLSLTRHILAAFGGITFLFSCQKDPSPDNSVPNGSVSYQVDSMRYTYKDATTGFREITSLYTFTYDNNNGEPVISKMSRTDTTDNALIKAVVYTDKQFTYNNKGQLINIYSKSRRKDLSTMQWIPGNSQVENYNISYSYAIPNIYNFPSSVTVDIYKDSSASTIYAHHPFTSVNSFNGYFGPNNLAYYLAINEDSVGFDDSQNIFWGGPYTYDPASRISLYGFIFNKSGFVSEFRAWQTPYDYFINVNTLDKEDQRRVQYQHDTSLTRLMTAFTGRKTYKYGIATEILFSRYTDLSNHERFLGIVNQLKTPALSSTDSTIRLDQQGHIVQVVEKEDVQGTITKDAEGRIIKLVKQINKTRTEFPVGITHHSQTFEFYYKK